MTTDIELYNEYMELKKLIKQMSPMPLSAADVEKQAFLLFVKSYMSEQ